MFIAARIQHNQAVVMFSGTSL